jgi:hypothetical protein
MESRIGFSEFGSSHVYGLVIPADDPAPQFSGHDQSGVCAPGYCGKSCNAIRGSMLAAMAIQAKSLNVEARNPQLWGLQQRSRQ